jgi:branched-chain amino acid aminotransferase
MGKAMALINGRLCPLDEAAIKVMDLGFLRGLAVFSTLQTYSKGCPYALPQHLDRLWVGGAELGIAPFIEEDDLRTNLARGYAAAGFEEVSFSVILTPGELTGGYFDSASPTLVVIVRPLPARPPSQRLAGVGIHTFEAARMLPGVKTTNYIFGRIGLHEAEQLGAHEAIYRNEKGYISEGVTSNIMLLDGECVRSPGSGCLEGITRATVHRVAERLGLSWEPGPVHRDQLIRADEVWLSSSIRELLPVVQVDGIPVGDGRPGEWYPRLYAALREEFEVTARRDHEAYLARMPHKIPS